MKKNKSFLLAGLATLSLVFAMSCSNPSSSASDSTSSTPAVKPVPPADVTKELKTVDEVKTALKTSVKDGVWAFSFSDSAGKNNKATATVAEDGANLSLADATTSEDRGKFAIASSMTKEGVMTLKGATAPFDAIAGDYKVTQKGGTVTFTEVRAEEAAVVNAEGSEDVTKPETPKPATVAKVLVFSDYKAPVTITYVTAHGTAPTAIVVPYGHKLIKSDLPELISGDDVANCGFTFKKQWNNGDNLAEVDNVITANTTLTAVWEDVAPTAATIAEGSTVTSDSITVTWVASVSKDVTEYDVKITTKEKKDEVIKTVTVGKNENLTAKFDGLTAQTAYEITLITKDGGNNTASDVKEVSTGSPA